jgi:hypothetical protein
LLRCYAIFFHASANAYDFFVFFALFLIEFHQAMHFEVILHYVERGKKQALSPSPQSHGIQFSFSHPKWGELAAPPVKRQRQMEAFRIVLPLNFL